MSDAMTTLVCLFHHHDAAEAALTDLRAMGLPESSIVIIGGPDDAGGNFERAALGDLGMPDGDYDHLVHGMREGGFVLAVSATPAQTAGVEKIFARQSAVQIDEAESTTIHPVARANDLLYGGIVAATTEHDATSEREAPHNKLDRL